MMPRSPMPPPPLLPGAGPLEIEQHRRWMARYHREKKEHNDMMRTNEAIMIVLTSITLVFVVGLVSALLFGAFGWKGPAGAVLAAGLFTVAVIEVRKRL